MSGLRQSVKFLWWIWIFQWVCLVWHIVLESDSLRARMARIEQENFNLKQQTKIKNEVINKDMMELHHDVLWAVFKHTHERYESNPTIIRENGFKYIYDYENKNERKFHGEN